MRMVAVCLAKNIYFDIINLAGKVAVAQVVLNNEHASYPKDGCSVSRKSGRENWKGQQVPIRHQCQFSWFLMANQMNLRH